MKREKRSRLGQFYQLMSVLLAALLLTNCSMASSATQNASQPAESIASSTEPATAEFVPSPQLPSPPAPMVVSVQDPDQAAGELVNALDGPEKLAAWLGLYQALGIPVIGMDRKALDGSDDPIGPAYWQVWYAASLDLPGHGVRISDAGRLLGQVLELSQEDSQALGEILLSDIRNALNSPDAPVHLLATFIRERILHTGLKMDLLDSATTPQVASLDIPTLQLIFWVVLREALIQRATQFSMNQGGHVLVVSHSQSEKLQAASLNCSEIYGNADATYWTNWLVNKAIGGVQLPGMEKALPGLLERALGELGMSEDSFATVSKALGWANAVGSAISLLMQLESMEVVGIQDPDKLIRTKEIKPDGEKATITWRLDTYPDNLDEGDKARQCFISYVSNILGAGFSFPEGGIIAGAELDFSGGMNIPDRVFIAKGDQVRSWTDSNGAVALSMLGRAQEHKVPASAKQVDMEYSVFVSAQPEEAGLNSMANIFFGGLTFGAAPGATGFISSMLDVLKTFTYDMGEHVFPMLDWQLESYRASGGQNMNMIGLICDLGKPFQLNAMGNNAITYDFSFSPDNDSSGSFQYSGSSEDCIESGGGSYTVQLSDDGSTGKVLVDVSGSVDCPDFSNTFSDTGSFDLTADSASSCP
jgi:hypothetical protein